MRISSSPVSNKVIRESRYFMQSTVFTEKRAAGGQVPISVKLPSLSEAIAGTQGLEAVERMRGLLGADEFPGVIRGSVVSSSRWWRTARMVRVCWHR